MTEPYAEDQIASLIQMLNFLCAANQGLKWIAGHEQLDSEKGSRQQMIPRLQVYRKRDPGPAFPVG